MANSNLNSADLLALMKEIAPEPRRSFLGDMLNTRPRFMGMDVFEWEPPPPRPKIQMRELTLSDGTPITTPEFRAEMNAWLIEQFGYHEDPFKNKAFILGNYGVVMSKSQIAMITNIGA